jgi:hypothetical protein
MMESARKKVGTFEADYVPFPSSKKHAASARDDEDNDARDDDEVNQDENDEEDDDDGNNNDEMMRELAEMTLPVFEKMPTPDEIEAAKLRAPIECEDADELVDEDENYIGNDDNDLSDHGAKNKKRKTKKSAESVAPAIKYKADRQTLLFSATAIDNLAAQDRQKGAKENKKRKRDAKYGRLPTHLQQ